MTSAFKIFSFLFFLNLFSFSQNATISGYVKDRSNGESAPGTTILIKEINKAASANQYGFYSLTVPKGKYTIAFTLLGYETFIDTINLDKNISLNVNMVQLLNN